MNWILITAKLLLSEKLFGDDKDTNYKHKLFIINSSNIFRLKDTEKNMIITILSFNDIKCILSEGEYVLLDKNIF